MTNTDSLKELNYKAIMTLYSYANEQKTATTDILRTIDDIITDTFINKNDIAKILIMVEKLTTLAERNINITDRNTTITEGYAKIINDTTKNNELMCYCIRDRNDKDDENNKILFAMFADEIDKINNQRRQEKFYYLCDFTLLVGAILALFWYK